jgi:hypothetical protein
MPWNLNLLPFQSITLVSNESMDMIFQKMTNAVRPPHIPRTYTLHTELTVLRRKSNEPYLFEGKLRENEFKIFLHSNYPEHFTPLIVGKIEPTSRGSIIFLTYQLMKGTWFIWGLGLLVFGALLLLWGFLQPNWANFGLTWAFFGAGYSVFLFNFRQKVKASHHVLVRILFTED